MYLRFLPATLLLTFKLLASPVQAQIASDGTTNTFVLPFGTTFLINGGTTAQSNLFHSFSQFSIPTGGTALFRNNANIANIFARVTGSNLSNIDGILATQNPANLFLLNPNGIIFGPNATLAINGSFFASSAESIVFKDGIEFSAAQPNNALLSVNVPIGLQMGSNPSTIVNQSQTVFGGQTVGLATIAPRTTIGLVGGEVNLTGGGITSVGGRIEIGAIGSNGFVGLVPDAMGYRLDYDRTNAFANINLSQQAFINAVGNTNIQLRGDRVRLTEKASIAAITTPNLSGGTLNIDARQIEMDNRGGIASITTTATTGATINLRAFESMNLVGVGSNQALQATTAILQGSFNLDNAGTTIASVTTGGGSAGSINIESPAIEIRNGGIVVSTTLGSGMAGSLKFKATDRMTVDSSSVFSGTVLGSTGNGGSIRLDTAQLLVRNGGQIGTATFGVGTSGSVAISATNIFLSDSRPALPTLSASLRANASRSAIASSTFGRGAAGDIDIRTRTLRVLDGAGITSNSIADITPNAGAGGNLSIIASDFVDIQGTSRDGVAVSELDSSTDSTSPAGSVNVLTGRFVVRDGAQVTAATIGGDGGRITVRANDSMTLSNQSEIVTTAFPTATGNSGSILLDTGNLNLTDSQIAANNLSSGGQGGSVNISTRQNLNMTRSSITATTASGNGGDLNFGVGGILLMRDNSLISTTAGQAGAGGNGGNINISAPFIVGIPTENSDITANAFTGNGGNIQISTNNIFGLQFRPQLTPLSDITASSQFGINGTVIISRLDVDPSPGLAELPVDLADPSQYIVSGCAAAREGNSFTVTGRGGLPTNPSNTLMGDRPWSDFRDLSAFREGDNSTVTQTSVPEAIVEANSWRIGPRGNIELIATGSSSTPTNDLRCDGTVAKS